jgi:hypothetical protein
MNTNEIKSSTNKPQANQAPYLEEKPSKLTRNDWRQLIQEWEKSGLAQTTFCRERDLVLHQFTYYRHVFLKERPSQSPLMPVRVNSTQAPSSHFILHLQNGMKLSIPSAYDESSLIQLLKTIGASV